MPNPEEPTDAAALRPFLWLGLIAVAIVSGSAGTAGGIKVQTFSLLFFAILSALAGVHDVQVFKRRVRSYRELPLRPSEPRPGPDSTSESHGRPPSAEG